jgi:transposase
LLQLVPARGRWIVVCLLRRRRSTRAAAIYILIETAKLNDTDLQAWLADVLARLPDHPVRRIAALLPWNWKLQQQQRAAA